MIMILATGGAGFIGSNVVLNWIAKTGTSVVNLDTLTDANNSPPAPAPAADHDSGLSDSGPAAFELNVQQRQAAENFRPCATGLASLPAALFAEYACRCGLSRTPRG